MSPLLFPQMHLAPAPALHPAALQVMEFGAACDDCFATSTLCVKLLHAPTCFCCHSYAAGHGD